MREKPFGSSSASYEELSRSLSVSFQEDEMYIQFFLLVRILSNSELSFGLLLIRALGIA
jgi:glucose-6-phosphate 1-dehydrogenase